MEKESLIWINSRDQKVDFKKLPYTYQFNIIKLVYNGVLSFNLKKNLITKKRFNSLKLDQSSEIGDGKLSIRIKLFREIMEYFESKYPHKLNATIKNNWREQASLCALLVGEEDIKVPIFA